MNDEILDDAGLARLWNIAGTPEAIAKRFQRLRALPTKNPRHLKSIKIGNLVRYKRSECEAYFDRNYKNLTSAILLAGYSDDDIAEMFDEHGNLT